ncbi:hypothetical protein M441DRAFT_418007 [Trichoderma asperellum CBS 433.97]|uniref:Uncharacterized protein n=1 Tax=Trichoderma asperellum (strain ATCC 204424 / CBS 433.97 / NBRC 101777) TaxID=1042311 RepID=A0A2T3Z8I9_TRIA4|nr:hypothetical protein M441DRAFT_418007 [Trichoderma asperellum CBS 433.97]PTB41106.1 hypothetical protein M441DRAFT_418007 [Trichoderma asperellum CBS 433.97]
MAQYYDNTHQSHQFLVFHHCWRQSGLSRPGSCHRDDAHYMYPKPRNTLTARPILNHPSHCRSTLDAAKKMYTSEGVASFYSGSRNGTYLLSEYAFRPARFFLFQTLHQDSNEEYRNT